MKLQVLSSFDCRDRSGIQPSCSADVGEPFTVDVHVAVPPDGGYNGFHIKLSWEDSALGDNPLSGTVTASGCSPGSISLGNGHASLDCPGFSSGSTSFAGVVAEVSVTCEQPGAATLDPSGTTLIDDSGQPITPSLIGGQIFCYAPPSSAVGDANCDGAVSSVDAEVVLQVDAGLVASTGCMSNGDTNHDGAVTSVDTELILQHEAGLIGPFS